MNLPPYATYPNVSDDRILLREIQDRDIENIVEISRYDGKKAKNVAEASAMQQKIHQNYLDGESIHWGIVDKANNLIVGTCGYYRGLAEGAGELGCILSAAHYGKGYMTAALRLAIDFGLKHIGLERVFAVTTQQNIKAVQLLERLGFVQTAHQEGESMEFELPRK